MIDEAIGKILGMAMAYAVSALGMFLAYVNYRRRVVKADKVMTPGAWGVIAITILAVVGGVFVVREMARSAPERAAVTAEQEKETATVPAPVVDVEPLQPASEAAAGEGPRPRWPLVGIFVPALVFLTATWITAALYRHFSQTSHDTT